MTANAFEALIFDCDGVLVDSEAIVQRVAREHLAEFTLNYSTQDFTHRFSGLTTTEFMRRIEDEYLRKFNEPLPQDFQERLNQAKRKALDQELVAIPGALDLVSRWKRPKAVASSSRLEPLVRVLNQMALLNYFDGHIYSAESVLRGKPDPSIFLLASQRLGVKPYLCAVIEDSVLGIRAAKAAQMLAIGFTGGDHCGIDHDKALYAVGADIVVSNFEQLGEVLGI